MAERPGSMIVRDATEHDIPAIQRIYAHHVLTGTASFEEETPSIEETVARRNEVVRRGLPYLIAELDGAVAGYAYAGPYRSRPAYRYTVESSIYVSHDQVRRGIGAALLPALITRCEAGPWRQLIAIIGDSGNAASIALHRRLGFRHVGTLHDVGWKLGRWLDSVIMQRALGVGRDAPPAASEAIA
jgi:L-amino acid N-acyltransferase YncA